MDMKQNLSAVTLLQTILKGLLGGAQMHFIHAQLNEQRDFSKLSKRMLEEYEEEMANAAQIMAHITRLGGEIKHEVSTFEIYTSIEEQIRQEAKIQAIGVEGLEEMKLYHARPCHRKLSQRVFRRRSRAQHLATAAGSTHSTIGIQNYLTTQL